MNGVLVLDKPRDLTSARAVARVKRRLKVKKAGHAGTLDPMATGVLPVLLGEGTKLARFFLEGDKGYRFTIRLGAATDTGDAEGAIISEADPAAVTAGDLEDVLSGLRGPIEQVPPMYSAIKQDGVRLYRLARQGREVPREPRAITVHRLVLMSFESPEAVLELDCTKGTYIREIAAEIGRRLGCGAHISELRRTCSGPFGEDRTVDLETLSLNSAAILSLVEATAHLSTIRVDVELARRIRAGHQPAGVEVRDGLTSAIEQGADVRLLGPGEQLVAVAEALVDLDPGAFANKRQALRLIRIFIP